MQQVASFQIPTRICPPPPFSFSIPFLISWNYLKRGSHAHAQWTGGAQQEQPQAGQEQDQQEEEVRL